MSEYGSLKEVGLPPSLKVNRDEEAEGVLYAQARDWLEKDVRPDGFHASDLLFPRMGYWRIVDPQPLTPRQVGLYLVGKVLHAFILGHADLTADEGSTYHEGLGLYYSPDKRLPVPTEIKTSRSFYEPKTLGDLDTYLLQVLIYMAAEDSTNGKLWVLYINARDPETRNTTPTFRVYDVHVKQEELDAFKLAARKLRDTLADAVQERNHRAVPLCPEWGCGPTRCPWWAKCQPEGRYENWEWIKKQKR